MITRIVRMEFREEEVDAFLALFNAYKSQIRNFPGVNHLELHRDATLPNVFYTYSLWDSTEDLNEYRKSEVFGIVWPQTKALFKAKPQAFSLVREMVIEP